MKFFKFISRKNTSLNRSYNKIKYEIGKEIVIEDIDLNREN